MTREWPSEEVLRALLEMRYVPESSKALIERYLDDGAGWREALLREQSEEPKVDFVAEGVSGANLIYLEAQHCGGESASGMLRSLRTLVQNYISELVDAGLM